MEQKSENGTDLSAQEPPKKMSRYEQIKAQIAKLQREKQQIENRQRAAERKVRTRRLIEIGALTLQHFNLTTESSAEEVAMLLQQVAPREEDTVRTAMPPKK